jgi:hypothetical protein
MAALGGARSTPRELVAWLGQKATYFRLRQGLGRYTEQTRFLELEALSLGIEGKLALWKLLRELAKDDARLAGFNFEKLWDQALSQRRNMETFRVEAGLRLAKETTPREAMKEQPA